MKRASYFSKRMENIKSSGIRRVFEKALLLEKSGRKIIHLELGRPDWPSPRPAVNAAIKALRDNKTYYIQNKGIYDLRKAVAEGIHGRSKAVFDPEREIIITVGASEAVAMTMLALLDTGDEVIIPTPAWPHYHNCALLAGAKPVSVPLSCGDGYQIHPERLERRITKRTRLMVINSPNNPTGAVYRENALRRLTEIARKHDIMILSDEIYEDYDYAGRFFSLLRLKEAKKRVILIGGFSKSYSMTGWRVGFIAADTGLTDALNRVHQYLTVCGNSFSQHGALSALVDGKASSYKKRLIAEYAERREFICSKLKTISCFEFEKPEGAFYIFAKFRYKNMASSKFAEFLMDKAGVAVVPGIVFGDGFDDCIRIAYSSPMGDLRMAAERLNGILGDKS